MELPGRREEIPVFEADALLLDQPSPILEVSLAEFLQLGVSRCCGLRFLRKMHLRAIAAGGLAALAPAFVAVETIIVQGLLSFVKDRTGQGGQPVQGRECLLGRWTSIMNGERPCRRLK